MPAKVRVERRVIRDKDGIMGEVIQMPKRNVRHASTAQLKNEWDTWVKTNEEETENVPGVEFHYEQIHAELNRRGDGEYCAV